MTRCRNAAPAGYKGGVGNFDQASKQIKPLTIKPSQAKQDTVAELQAQRGRLIDRYGHEQPSFETGRLRRFAALGICRVTDGGGAK